MKLLSCFAECFGGHLAENSEFVRKGSRHSSCRPSTTVIAGDWQTVPDDVLQAVLVYLTSSEVATARLTCRHWRLTLSSYTPALTLPTRFLGSKAARGALRRAGRVFPGAQQVTLSHANGWCDPVQARMDVEPLVRLESRLVSLEHLAIGLPQLTRLAIQDATFTRDPWPLSQLLWLTGLKGSEVCWDTGLWAPGQVRQEAEALQPVFSMTQLTELKLAKNAYMFLGEICLGDSTLAAAAGLRNLAKLSLSTIRVQDEGFASLAMLPHLTHLTLRGQLNVKLGVMSQVFLATTKLEELSLGCLVPSNYDLKRLAAAHSALKRAPATRQQQQQRTSVRRQLAHQQQLHETCRAAAPAVTTCTTGLNQRSNSTHSSSGSGSSYRRRPTSCQSFSQPGCSFSFEEDSRADISTHSSSSSSSTSHSSGSTNSSSRSTCSSIGLKFKGDDWSAVLLPLQRLRRLQLQSDLVLLGSCAALKSMASISQLDLHGAAKFLSAGPFARLPPSWLSTLAQQHSTTTVGASTAAVAASSNMVQVSSGSSSSYEAGNIHHGHPMPGWYPSAPHLVNAQGAWPALKSLQVDNLQLADEFIEGVRQLASLRTLIVSGPCLLAQRQTQGDVNQRQQWRRQQQQLVNAAGPMVPTPEGCALHQQQQQLDVVTSAEGGAPGSVQHPLAQQIHSRYSASEMEAASGSSNEGAGSAIKQQQHHKQQQQHAALPELRGLSALSAQLEKDCWLDPTDNITAATAAGSGTAGIVGHAPTAAAATAAVPGLGSAQQTQVGGAAAAQLPGDLDMLSRLSPLEELSCFQLLLPQNMHRGVAMTPFALVHLAAHWNHLTSISIDITAAAAAATSCWSDQHHDSCAAAEVGVLLSSLASFTSLKDLTLRLADDLPGDSDISNEVLQSGSVLPAAATAAVSSSATADGQHKSAWASLPSSIESLSLHGFALDGAAFRELGTALSSLKHLRLIQGHVSTQVLWCIALAWPLLSSLVVKSVPMMGVGASGVAAVAALTQLRVLSLSLQPMADVSPLAELTNLRFLLLDGRSNTQLSGVKSLRRLTALKALVMPLLHLHHSNKGVLTALQLGLPNTAISNISSSFGQHHGYQWFNSFSFRDREWWREPDVPWHWYPTLCIVP